MDEFRDTHQASVNGASLAYVDDGEGPAAVVLVHGSVSDLRTWKLQRPALAQSFRTIAYSRRYARPNQDIPDGVDDQTMPHVEDLIALLEQLKLESAHLVGHSWGGLIALIAAMRRPDLVGKLVLLEPPVMTLFIDIPPKPSQILKLLLTRPALAVSIIKFATRAVGPAQKHYRAGEDKAALAVFGRGIFGGVAFESISEERMEQAHANIKADKAQVTGAGFPSIDKRDVSAITSPVLLLYGQNSPPLFRRMTVELEKLMTGATRREVPSASHLLHEDNPAFVSQAILEFLTA